jgi:hypothetical protein
MIGIVTSWDGSNGRIIDADKGGDAQLTLAAVDILSGSPQKGSLVSFTVQLNANATPPTSKATNVSVVRQ